MTARCVATSDLPLLIGDSLSIRRLKGVIAKVGPTDLPVLIEGPTGAGKELVARALHAASGRPGGLVAFNVCAIPESMLEGALFGHVRGGFTGAREDVEGYLAEADRGTVLFDEIGALPLALQCKLLRVIEAREFRPIGGRADRRSDFRMVSATNECLGVLVAAGRFRADLAYRLRAFVLSVPALKDRMDDVPVLAQHFARAAGRTVAIEGAALALLLGHDWPGNVRELRHVIESALVFCDGPTLAREHIAAALQHGERPRVAGLGEEFPRRRLVDVLERVAWDTAAAAQLLGVHRVTVYRRMHRHGIPVRRRRLDDGFARVCANLHPFAANPAE